MPIYIKSQRHKIDIRLPGAAEEVTTQFFIDFCKVSREGELSLLSHYSGMTEQELLRLDYTQLDDEVFGALAFMGDLQNSLPLMDIPAYVYLFENGEGLKVPKNLEFINLGQKLRLKKLIQDFQNEDGTIDEDLYLDSIVKAFVIYFQPLTDLSEEQLETIVRDMRIIDVYPVISFFLFKLSRL